MLDIKVNCENEINIYNDSSNNYIVFDLTRNSIIEFNNIIVDKFNEYFLSDKLYLLYVEFECILKDIV